MDDEDGLNHCMTNQGQGRVHKRKWGTCCCRADDEANNLSIDVQAVRRACQARDTNEFLRKNGYTKHPSLDEEGCSSDIWVNEVEERVAKVLRPDPSRPNTHVTTCLREINMLKHVGSHRNIVKFIRGSGSLCCIEFEMLSTEDMMTKIMNNHFADKQNRTLIPLYSFDILHALEHLHGRNIVHMDVKAENVCFANISSGSMGRSHAKLIDFGSAIVPEDLEDPALRLGHVRFTRSDHQQSLSRSAQKLRRPTSACLLAEESWCFPKLDVWGAAIVIYMMLHCHMSSLHCGRYGHRGGTHWTDDVENWGLPVENWDLWKTVLDGMMHNTATVVSLWATL